MSEAGTERRFVTCVREDSGGRVKRWAFDVTAVAVAAGVSETAVRSAIKVGHLDLDSLRSVSCWVSRWVLAGAARE